MLVAPPARGPEPREVPSMGQGIHVAAPPRPRPAPSAAGLYARCLPLDWCDLLAELDRLDGLAAAHVREQHEAMGFATPFRSKRRAVERIRRRVITRKGNPDPLRLPHPLGGRPG